MNKTHRPWQSSVLFPHVECSASQGRPSQGSPGLSQKAPRLEGEAKLSEEMEIMRQRNSTYVFGLVSPTFAWTKPATKDVLPGIASGSTISLELKPNMRK